MTRGRSAELVGKMESDLDLEEALAGLGYRRFAVKEAIKKIPKEISGMESRLREALKILGKQKMKCSIPSIIFCGLFGAR